MNMDEKNTLMTVGLLGIYDTDKPAVTEILGAIRGQDLPAYELLVCPDIMDETTIQQILEGLHLFPNENCLRTRIQPFSYESGAAEAMRWIVSNAKGELVLFHTLSETLYDAHVLSNYWQAFQGREESLGLMRTLVCKKSDQSWTILPAMEAYAPLNTESTAKQVRFLRSSGKKLCSGGICFRKEALRETRFENGSLRKALFDAMMSTCEKGVIALPEFCATRHFCEEFPEKDSIIPLYVQPAEKKPLGPLHKFLYRRKNLDFLQKISLILSENSSSVHEDILNLTDYLALETAVNAALEICGNPTRKPDRSARQALTEKLIRLCDRICAKVQGGTWGFTDSQYQLLCYLKKLIDLLDLPRQHAPDYQSLLSDAKSKARTKFRICFFLNEHTTWTSLKSAYEAVYSSQNLEAQMVYLPFQHVNKTIPDEVELEAYHTAGYQPTSYHQYDVSRECPDVAVYVKPYDAIPPAFTIGEIHRVVPRCLYIPYCMEIMDDMETLYVTSNTPMQFYAWRVVAYCKDYYEKMRECTYTQGENFLLCGHPRTDLRFQDYSANEDYQAIKQKAGDRRIVLWNTVSSLGEGNSMGTFFRFGSEILDYFSTHTDIFLLWRPHPLFYGTLARLKNKSVLEINEWFESLHMKENVYIDRSLGYLPAFAVSDAMVSDVSSFVPGYLSWGKPLIVTCQSEVSDIFIHTLKHHLNFEQKVEGIIAFLDTIRSSDLPAPSVSEDIAKEMFIPQEGTVGGRLADYIDRQIRREQSELLKSF